MVIASRMQNMVQIRKNNAYLVTKKFVRLFLVFTFRDLGVESPRGGAIETMVAVVAKPNAADWVVE